MRLLRALRRLLIALVLASAACAPPVPVPLTPAPVPEDAPPGERLPGPWWSVRIHSDEESGPANDVASAAIPRFDEPVTVVHRGGRWHVHVGTFSDEERALAVLALARSRGYRSAAVVRVAPPDETEGR